MTRHGSARRTRAGRLSSLGAPTCARPGSRPNDEPRGSAPRRCIAKSTSETCAQHGASLVCLFVHVSTLRLRSTYSIIHTHSIMGVISSGAVSLRWCILEGDRRGWHASEGLTAEAAALLRNPNCRVTPRKSQHTICERNGGRAAGVEAGLNWLGCVRRRIASLTAAVPNARHDVGGALHAVFYSVVPSRCHEALALPPRSVVHGKAGGVFRAEVVHR